VDSDDDAIVLKSLSAEPCRNVTITDCTISSHCNALKMGTESGGGFVDITISNCTVFSPKHSKVIYGKQRGLAGVALEIVDGGKMENVNVSDVKITGVTVPIFVRLGNRARLYNRTAKPGVGTLRNVHIRNITGTSLSPIGCAIAGLPGHPVENITLENINLSFEGGGDITNTVRKISERPDAYPESTMFGMLPAFGFYCRHVKGVRFTNVTLRTEATDARHAVVLDDAENVIITGLDVAGAAVRVQGVATREITLKKSVGACIVSLSSEVPATAVTQKQ
jgi:polygalacturonase